MSNECEGINSLVKVWSKMYVCVCVFVIYLQLTGLIKIKLSYEFLVC